MTEDKRPKKIIDLKKYNDPTGLAAKNLDFGLWVANNQRNLYKILIIFLIIVASGLAIYASYGYIYYFVFGRAQDQALTQDVSGVNLAAYRLQNKPLDLQIGKTQALNTKTGSDLIAHLINPNEKQFAVFDFCFKSGENSTCGSSFIMPKESKDVVVINNSLKIADNQIKFELSNIRWQKLNAGEVPNWDDFKANHLQFNITEPTFSSYSNNISYLEFDISNESPYGYFEIPLNIIISQGEETVAVNRYIIKDFNSRDKKSVRLSWPEASGISGTIKVVPDLNIMDATIYKPYRSN